MDTFDIEAYVRRSRALDLRGIDWDAVPRHPLPDEAVRTLRYMQDIESHTIIYLRTLLSTRAVDDPDVAAFLACWVYEETHHGRALAQFLRAAGHETFDRPARSRVPLGEALRARLTSVVARAWPDFVAVHMTWGAINELTTYLGYQRLAQLAGHPVLAEILARIMRDEMRHFSFYYHEAEKRLVRPRPRASRARSSTASGRRSAAPSSRSRRPASSRRTSSPAPPDAPPPAASTRRYAALPASPASRSSRRGSTASPRDEPVAPRAAYHPIAAPALARVRVAR
jgi:hypothetical protein